MPKPEAEVDPKIKLFSDFVDDKITQLPKNFHLEFLEYCEKSEPLILFDPTSRDIQRKYVRAYQKIKMQS